MIAKLSEIHKENLFKFLLEDPNFNLFIIGDIEANGFEESFQEIWGKFDKEENINGNLAKYNGVLLRYKESFIPYIKNIDEDVFEFKEIINSYKFKKTISGKDTIVEKFKDVLRDYTEKRTFLCELKDATQLLKWDDSIKIARPEDANRICDLLGTIDEFGSTKYDAKFVEFELKRKSRVTYYIEGENNEIAHVSNIVAENSRSAMIVGVATRKKYRNRGYAQKCISKLSNDLLAKNKTICLFYNNPEAGKIYLKLGYKEIGKWTILGEK